MKKFMMLAMAAALSVSLMACGGGNAEPSAAPESTQEAAPEQAENLEQEGEEVAEEAADTAASASADIPAEYAEWIPSFAGETYTQEQDGHIGVGYVSSESLENTKKFYTDKIAAAGYTEVLNQDQEAGWMYSGMMDATTSLTVLVVEAQGQVVGSVAIVSAADAS